MPKRMNDDDVMNYVYGKLFGDLDGIESHALFDENEGTKGMHEIEGTAMNAEPEEKGSGGVKMTIEPLMASVAETGKMSSGDDDKEDEDEKDRLKGIGGMSSLMAQLHGSR